MNKTKKYTEPEINSSYVEEPHVGYNEAKDFTSLICWQKARSIKLFFYAKIIPLMPKAEEFNLAFQMRKSCVSITENIAEGYERFHYQELLQFCRIARGSMFELKDDLITCIDLKFISEDLYNEGIKLIEGAKLH
ncbi:MAG: four helix bundle protein [Bacteroidetes bacterium]|nr:four helix bundle protein [Bacteroidota bacterium]